MQTLIRAATQDDVDTLFEIRTSVVQNHLSIEQMAELGITPQLLADSMREAPCVWIAEVDGQPVAFAMVDLAEGEVFAMFVLPSHENLGLGRQLMAVAEAALFEHHDRLFLITDGRDEIRANGFYRHLGWSVVERVEGDDVRYQKSRAG
ncbi:MULTISPECIES: GNAT family N-acetyltransferase [Pseudomonas]|uniref:GNAT family N-acetyltransferase n=1 Tax=Pseudomonas marginalis TaxID=298 RepID=A0A9X9BQP3_PSEMA|nr:MULTISPECIES: GNAT family N-acetyltransferase [Pseudomonas]MDT9632080.1 GNAT family N-acetyltransferase [Pseudomonas sp. JV449]TKJ75528.1 GNAT family N-acetyltransferase [Pseudomonas sp. CFBP13509]TWR57455.1 GNAT family N-acetyltransferase [Pseudomonas marginalis]CRM82619.1 putative acetyltransferase [Pseudomonas sp. 8 R 14]SEC28703.1 Acetyltransferase (GNAT) domain-containing protein [Pseudomonas marginalis]